MQIYIHIPFCERKCNYCDFLSQISTKDDRYKYTKAIQKELTIYRDIYKDRKITSVFIGGGTPTFLECEYLLSIVDTLKKNYNLNENTEFTIECNPKSASLSTLKAYRKSGINRISIGLQSANLDELKMLGRIHNYNDFLRTFQHAREAGFYNINVDIMTALPFQTEEKLLNTLKSVVMLRPEHISAYDLIIEENTLFFNKYIEDVKRRERGDKTLYLPNEEDECRFTNLTEDYLKSHRYKQYEISNFSKEGKECIHNKGYWERNEYLGVGVGAASLMDETRWKNETNINKYIETLLGDNKLEHVENIEEIVSLRKDIHKLSKKEAIEEFFFLGLREIDGVSRDRFYKLFDRSVDSVYKKVISNLKSKKLLIEDKGYIKLTKRGRDISNLVLADFLL